MKPENLLIADLEHFGELLWRNEEMGEKRFSFFMTLVTAVISALVALVKINKTLSENCVIDIVGAALIVLLVFGILTYLRMIQRNHVTDEYKRTLKYIRKRCVSLCESKLDLYEVPQRNKTGWSKWLRGGYAETVGAINSIMLGVLLFLYSTINIIPVIVISFAFFILQWFRANYAREFQKKKTEIYPEQYFRTGVGAMIIDDTGRLLVLKRSDTQDAWQLPQGGLKKKEEPKEGILREIFEETGISYKALEFIDEYPIPLTYELPQRSRSRKTGRGQVQYWFLLKFNGNDSEVNISDSDESIAWRWMTVKQILSNVVDFRSRIYKLLTEHFSKQLHE